MAPEGNLPCVLLIPAFNEAERIEACLSAALSSPLPQGFIWREWILADDASDDGTADIASKWAATTGRALTIVRHATRKGKLRALNYCHQAFKSRGEDELIIVCCDADGAVEGCSFSKLLEPLGRDHSIAIAWGVKVPETYGPSQYASAFQADVTRELVKLRGPAAYRAESSLFAYRPLLLANFHWRARTGPDDVQLADWALAMGLPTWASSDAVISVRPAAGFRDFRRQLTRPRLASGGNPQPIAPSKTKLSLLIWAILKTARRHPLEAISYVAVRLRVKLHRVSAITEEFSDTWQVAESTKVRR